MKNRSFRFTRLDHVDDLEEAIVEQRQYDLSKFLFVSCWTENREESVPLWKMYSSGAQGVRIGVEKEMFPTFCSFSFDRFGNITDIRQMIAPDDKQKDFFVLPVFDYGDSPFYRKVEYVDDVHEASKGVLTETVSEREACSGGSHKYRVEYIFDMKRLGAIKHSRWAFQDESRYSLLILPGNPYIRQIDEATSIMIHCVRNGLAVPFSFYDVPLAPAFFHTLEVTLSPSATESQRIIVQSLCNSFAPNAIVKDSALKGKVSLK